MSTSENPRAQPPETLEGWYALHQLFTVDRDGLARASAESLQSAPRTTSEGWTAWARVIGSTVDVMAVHFAPTLDAIGELQTALWKSPAMTHLSLKYSFLSVTEAGLYHLTAELAKETIERG